MNLLTDFLYGSRSSLPSLFLPTSSQSCRPFSLCSISRLSTRKPVLAERFLAHRVKTRVPCQSSSQLKRVSKLGSFASVTCTTSLIHSPTHAVMQISECLCSLRGSAETASYLNRLVRSRPTSDMTRWPPPAYSRNHMLSMTRDATHSFMSCCD